jgi:hypothetical protein
VTPHKRGELGVVAVTRPKRLFTKNTGPCEVVRRGIRTDACPVLERYEERLAVLASRRFESKRQ